MLGKNTTISTTRLSETDGKKTYSANLTGVEAYLQPASAEILAQLQGVQGYKVYQLICDEVVDIEENDRVTDADSVTYSVYGVEHFNNNIEIPSHTEVILRKEV